MSKAQSKTGFVSVESDLEDVMKTFHGLAKDAKVVRGNVLKRVGQVGRNKAKRNYTSVLNKRSGSLHKSIRTYLSKDKKTAVVTAHKKGDSNRYGFMLAHGYTITPKNGDYLTFRIGDKWVKRHSVTVEPKDFIEGPVNRYIKSAECRLDMEAKLQKEIERIERREAKKEANGR